MAGRGPVAWQTIGKAVVTVTMLALVLSRTDVQILWAGIVDALGWWFAAGFAVSALLLLTSTLKWQGLLRASGILVSGPRLFAVYTIGFFVSALLPGMIAGDVVRCRMAGRGWNERLTVAATILLERFTGVVTLVVMAVVVLVGYGPELATMPIVVLVAAMAGLALVAVTTVVKDRFTAGLAYRTRRAGVRGLTRALYRLHRTLRRFPGKPLLAAVGYSVVFYLIGGLAFFFICAAFGVRVTYVEATSVQVLTCLLAVIPISIGGLGLAQVADVYLLGILGVDPTSALGVSLLRQVVNYGYALVGATLFVAWQPPTADPIPAPAGRWGRAAPPSGD
jgi:hypothetical protein